MSRIVGCTSSFNSREAQRSCERAIASISQDGWKRRLLTFGSASLGWTGPGTPQCAQVGEAIGVVDGHILNAEELWSLVDEAPSSHAELLLKLSRRVGFERAVALIHGEVAVALYDGPSDQLWLARDRIGHRPLYYAEVGSGIAFASRPAALLTVPSISREVNRRFVAIFAGSHYRYFDNVSEESPFVGIQQVPAATICCPTRRPSYSMRYWRLQEESDFDASEEALAEQYCVLLHDAVRRRLDGFQNPAFTLSGGLDSSTVLACAVGVSGRKLHAFSSIYQDKTYDESAEIHDFLEDHVAHWHPVSIEGFDLFETVRSMVAVHDEPVATATWLSHYLLCRSVRQAGFDALFGGLGGDELNAGEYEYFIYHFADLAYAGRLDDLTFEIECWARHHDHPIFRKNRAAAERAILEVTDPDRSGYICPDRQRLRRYYSAVSREYYDLETFCPRLDHPFQSWLKNRTYQDLFRETTPCCLRAEDRNSLAFSLDHADPLLDHRLLEFMFRVPGSMKIREGITKRLLRTAMKQILPESTRTRIKKTGWNAPAHLWFSRDALSSLRDLVASRAFRERGVYEVPVVTRLLDEHVRIVESHTMQENHMMFFWQLLNLELWFQHLDRQRTTVREAIDRMPT